MGEPITITWVPTEAEVRQAMKLQFAPPKLKTFWLCLLLLSLCAGYLSATESKPVGALAALVSTGLAVLMLLIPVIAARKVISMHPSQHPIGLSSRGLEINEQGKAETLEWGEFASAIERTEVYILKRESVVFPYPIPKRAFASPEQAPAFRELLISRGLLKAKG